MKQDKFNFKGTWYPIERVRYAACTAYKLDEKLVDTEEKLHELVDSLVKGRPNNFSIFMVILNEGIAK